MQPKQVGLSGLECQHTRRQSVKLLNGVSCNVLSALLSAWEVPGLQVHVSVSVKPHTTTC